MRFVAESYIGFYLYNVNQMSDQAPYIRNINRLLWFVKAFIPLFIILYMSFMWLVFSSSEICGTKSEKGYCGVTLGCGTYDMEQPKTALNEQSLKGKELFENNCAPCHSIHHVMVGPSLKGITDRREMKWIVKWVQNPSEMIASKDPYALKLAKEYKSTGVMTAFTGLKKEEIENIIAYISSY